MKTSDTFLLPHAVVESERGLEDGEGCKESSTLEGIPRMNGSVKSNLILPTLPLKLRCRPRCLREKKRGELQSFPCELHPEQYEAHDERRRSTFRSS